MHDAVEALFRAHPEQAISFLKPLLQLGSVLTIFATALDGLSLWRCADYGCAVPQIFNGAWGETAPEVLWVVAQVALQLIHFPVRLMILRRVKECAAEADAAEAAASLADLSRSSAWAVNKFLGCLHALWFVAGCGIYYWSTYLGGGGTCPLRRLLLLHTCIFVGRCCATFLWFAAAFAPERQGLPGLLISEARDFVQKLPSAEFNGEERAIAEGRYTLGSCVICLQDFNQGESLPALSCGHCFHPDCLSQWLAHRRACPLCQRWDEGTPRALPALAAAPLPAVAAAAGGRGRGEEQPRRRHHAVQQVG